ncbi:MAG TPA: hypothetical protein ENO00_09635 [Deltaproteobacteria bacterium]|nr:hypothetical protein [Deltaproteobacteria bacterium]
MTAMPKDAATVILLRDHPDSEGFEILMVLRHPKSVFVPNSFVFPGGVLEENDYAPDMERLCIGLTRQTAEAQLENLSSPEIALGTWVCGIRETFEEVGLLLAHRDDGRLLVFDSDETAARFHTHRRLLFEGKRSLDDILREEELRLATDRLHYFSHWITPEFLPLRYDVRFFVAMAPEEQEARHDGVELTGHVWITPQEALERFRNGKCNMVLPTLITMEELSGYETAHEVIESTRQKNIQGILTRMVEEDGEIVEYMPDGRGFKNLPPSS